MNLFKIIKDYIHNRPRIKKAVGVILILVGLTALSPLQDIHDETIFNKLSLAINSVIKGSLAAALVDNFLTYQRNIATIA